MHAFEAIAEQRIKEAVARGDLDDLPGSGQPLDLNDDPLIPEDLRMAYRILKNAGFVPPEVHTLQQIGALERLVQTLEEGEQRDLAMRKLRLLGLQMSESRAGSLLLDAVYYPKLINSLTA